MQALLNRLKMMITRAKISGDQIDGLEGYGAPITQFRGNNRAQVIYPYGYLANPISDTLAITVALMGSPANLGIFPYHKPNTPFLTKDLAEGEVIIGNPTVGNNILFKKDGSLIISSKKSIGSLITLKTDGSIEIKGDLNVIGNITATGDISDSASTLDAMRNAYNPHTHIDSSTNPTSAPDNLMPT